ncbi:hypothetical protein BDN70DRAFT_822873 [Pholiota conissans]|uniref:F-box domain-containing protein n=1 Tax=Pholiota conissans TaxID=109636 RepID=A0A9P5ZEN8_9AGAR|nr:hypothetical protein BDN70DRAFT_822873 [Pholiota conissans]
MGTSVPYGRSMPPEIWSHVLDNVPRTLLPNLLSVCSQFHDIAIRTIFASIKIYFLGGRRGMEALNTFDTSWTAETATKLICKSWEILNRICQDPQFARVVKSITVIAFSDGLGMIEKLTVANVFPFVPNLQTFRWIGDHPSFDDIVAKNLPQTLNGLIVQSPTFPLNSLRHIQNMKTLHLSIPFFYPDDEEAHDGCVEDFYVAADIFALPIEDVLNTFSTTLQSLRLCASHIRSVPIRIYSTLLELEIVGTISDAEELTGLDVMFRYATFLESLTLAGYLDYAFASFLPHHSVADALPRLTSFRLSTEYQDALTEDAFSQLCGFLHGRKLLRRLYLRLPEMNLDQTTRLLPVIKDLTGLEVLGLHTGRHLITNDHLAALVDSISPNLRALHLAMNWGGDTLLQLVDGAGKLPHLSFLHLYGVVSRLPVLIGDLAEEAPGLNTIGLNRALWSIDRVGSEILTTKWPRWKIKFCVEADFCSPDDSWLFKYN